MKSAKLGRTAKAGRITSSKVVGFGALKGTVVLKRIDITKPILNQAAKPLRAAKK